MIMNARKSAGALVKRGKKWLTKAYAAGPELEDALQMCEVFRQREMAVDVCYWGDDSEDPRDVADSYIATIRAVAEKETNAFVSIKAMLLHFDKQLVDEVMRNAEDAGVGVYLDSRAIELADQIQSIAAEYASGNNSIRCAIPGRWERSLEDAERLAGRDVGLRVVKGQWRDPENPTINLREGFLAVIERLAGKAKHVSVATHDEALARQSLQRLIDTKTPCELELLFGLPMRGATKVAQELGVRTRVYIPYGRSWVPYAFRQAIRHPHIMWWAISDTLLGRRSQFIK